jgi:Sulfotransferase family
MPDPTPPYRKHDDDEAFLEWLNGLLAGPEAEGYQDLEERHPTVHVLGLPRSGTTLALQLIAAHTTIDYVDHVAAAFPQAPTVGLRLAQKLRRGLPRTSSYASDFGRTASLSEPHEFTYFWSQLLDLPYGLDGLAQPAPGHHFDWDRVRRVLTNLCAAVDGPLAFKSFHVIWQLEAFCRALPRTVVVRIRRDRLQVAQSLLRMRESLYDSRDAWASIRPREYAWLKDEDWATQIAGQIVYTSRALDAGTRFVVPGALVEIDYDLMCREPGTFLDAVAAAVSAQGGEATVIDRPSGPFAVSGGTRDSQDVTRLSEALERMNID